MKSIGRSALTAFGLAIIVAAFTLAPAQRASGTSGPSPVQVVNTPLPIAGNVTATIGGTPSVTANQGGAWTVGLANGAAVTIGNAATSPVLVRNVDEAGQQQPWALHHNLHLADGEQSTIGTIYTVPNGYRLVIEHESAFITLPAGQQPLLLGLFGGLAQEFLHPEKGFGDATSVSYELNCMTQVHYGVGAEVVAQFNRGGSLSSFANASLNLSGRLIPTP